MHIRYVHSALSLKRHQGLAGLVQHTSLGFVEPVLEALVAHTADRHQRPCHISDLEAALEFHDPAGCGRPHVQQNLHFVGHSKNVADDELLLTLDPW